MISLLLSLTQGLPIDIPTERVVSIDDKFVGRLGAGAKLRGYLVSEDGAGVFARSEKGIETIRTDRPLYEVAFAMRVTNGEPVVYTSSAKWVLEQKGTKDGWENVRIESLLRADDAEHLTFAFSDGDKQFGVTTIHWDAPGSEPGKTIYRAPAGVGFAQAWVDRAGLDFYLDFFNLADNQSTGYGTASSATRMESKPGFQPIFFDSKSKRFLGYHYSESGFPHGFSFKAFAGGEPVAVKGQERMEVKAFAWTPAGLLASFSARDGAKLEPGIYLLEESAQTWKKVSSCSIEGQSASGRHLLLSDLKERKSWIVTLGK